MRLKATRKWTIHLCIYDINEDGSILVTDGIQNYTCFIDPKLIAIGRYELPLRTVPTIVTAHTFCASRDTRVSYGWCLLIQGYFCAV